MKFVKKVQTIKALLKYNSNCLGTVTVINCKINNVNSNEKKSYNASVLKYKYGIIGIKKVNQNFQYIIKKMRGPTAYKVVIHSSNKRCK
jgi:hypothetical protein